MAYRNRPKNSPVDPEDPRAEGQCDRCGMLWPLHKLTWQMAYRGFNPQSLGILVCPTHLDPLNILDAPLILPPDPEPVFNERSPTYSIDEAGPAQSLIATIVTDEVVIGTDFYIDLYDGDPETTGESVLEDLTGSAIRTNHAASMGAPVSLLSANTAAIEITELAPQSARVTHVAVFDAAFEGSLVMSAPLANPQTVTMFNGAMFEVGALKVKLAPILGDGDYFSDDYFATDYFATDYFA
jgi:hypothetical protein